MLERFHRSMREEIAEEDLQYMAAARELITHWIKHYKEEQLHAGLRYLESVVYYSGDLEARCSERASKLARAREERRRSNEERLKLAA